MCKAGCKEYLTPRPMRSLYIWLALTSSRAEELQEAAEETVTITVIFAPEMGAEYGVAMVQGAPDEVLNTCSFSGIDEVFAMLGFVSRSFGLVEFMNRIEGPDYGSMSKMKCRFNDAQLTVYAENVDQQG